MRHRRTGHLRKTDFGVCVVDEERTDTSSRSDARLSGHWHRSLGRHLPRRQGIPQRTTSARACSRCRTFWSRRKSDRLASLVPLLDVSPVFLEASTEEAARSPAGRSSR